MSVKREGDGLEMREGYERPTVVLLGTVAELTAAAGPGNADAAVFSNAVPSDRRLKTDFHPVTPVGVLATLAELTVA